VFSRLVDTAYDQATGRKLTRPLSTFIDIGSPDAEAVQECWKPPT
jgi:hypothetical protein